MLIVGGNRMEKAETVYNEIGGGCFDEKRNIAGARCCRSLLTWPWTHSPNGCKK